MLGPADVDHSDSEGRERIELLRRHLRARAASFLRQATRRWRQRRESYYSNPTQNGVGAATWITIGIVVYIALVTLGMPDFCHMVSPAHANDLEEPLSPKEPQEEAIPRGANH